MEVAILVILIAIRYEMNRGQTTEIGSLIATMHFPFGYLRRFINARFRLVIGSVTGVCILGLEDFYFTGISKGGA